jgi:hypothetical protein
MSIGGYFLRRPRLRLIGSKVSVVGVEASVTIVFLSCPRLRLVGYSISCSIGYSMGYFVGYSVLVSLLGSNSDLVLVYRYSLMVIDLKSISPLGSYTL